MHIDIDNFRPRLRSIVTLRYFLNRVEKSVIFKIYLENDS